MPRHLQHADAVGQLAAGVAHDFNNLLSVIATDTSLLMMAHPPGDPDHETLDGIRKVATRGKRLTRHLLALSRMQEPRPCAIDLNDTIRSFAPILKRLAGRRVTFVVRLESDVPAICAGEGQIERVLMNLVANARDAMPQGGRLRIRTSAKARPGWVTLIVADTGEGMPADVIARSIEPFFTTKEDSGTGLGLSIISGIVERSGGTMRLDSEPNRGTTITIELPVRRPSTPASR